MNKKCNLIKKRKAWHIGSKSKFGFILYILLGLAMVGHSQSNTRILFLLDASGSMNQKLEGKSKYETAMRLIYELADSLEKAKSKVQIGVRVFGHQYARAQHNCLDSRLEIPFSATNAVNIKHYLSKIKPKGYTPLAYSIFEAAQHDFVEKNTFNTMILVTDGIETCDGNPCAASLLLEQKRICLKPFIIGLQIEDSLQKKFDCIGTFFDTKTEKGFGNVLRTVLSQITGSTTVQINLLNQNGEATESNVELTFSDAYNGDLRYSMVHSFNQFGNSDTLRLDPIGKYNIKIHTLPAIIDSNVVLKPGRHNIFGVDAAQGLLQLSLLGPSTAQALQQVPMAVIRQAGKPLIINVQDLNSSNKYLSGNYDIEVLTLPSISLHGVAIKPSETKNISIPTAGTAAIFFPTQGLASIYNTVLTRWEKVYDWGKIAPQTVEVNLQPGEYDIVFKPENKRGSEYTQTKHLIIESGKLARIVFK
jgi:Ca-activated chloride channel family protein